MPSLLSKSTLQIKIGTILGKGGFCIKSWECSGEDHMDRFRPEYCNSRQVFEQQRDEGHFCTQGQVKDQRVQGHQQYNNFSFFILTNFIYLS